MNPHGCKPNSMRMLYGMVLVVGVKNHASSGTSNSASISEPTLVSYRVPVIMRTRVTSCSSPLGMRLMQESLNFV